MCEQKSAVCYVDETRQGTGNALALILARIKGTVQLEFTPDLEHWLYVFEVLSQGVGYWRMKRMFFMGMAEHPRKLCKLYNLMHNFDARCYLSTNINDTT